jgi:hypothetical protein
VTFFSYLSPLMSIVDKMLNLFIYPGRHPVYTGNTVWSKLCYVNDDLICVNATMFLFCFVFMRDTRGRRRAGGLDLKPENLGTTLKQFFCVKKLSLKRDNLRIVDSLLTDRFDGLQDFVSSVIIGSLALDPETCFDCVSIMIVTVIV